MLQKSFFNTLIFYYWNVTRELNSINLSSGVYARPASVVWYAKASCPKRGLCPAEWLKAAKMGMCNMYLLTYEKPGVCDLKSPLYRSPESLTPYNIEYAVSN